MSFYYYWNDKIPSQPNFTSVPNYFFNSLLYPYNETTHDGDHFSGIVENYADLTNALHGISTDVGFEYYAVYLPGSNNNVGYSVVYVKKDTDAASKLHRGDYITAVDDVSVTENNYGSLLSSGKSAYKLNVLNGETGQSSVVTINVVYDYAENPIYESKVFEPVNGQTIGYLVYNFFATDKGDNSYQYDIELTNLLSRFKTKGVTDLVLDLRYNGGGFIQSAIYLASALVNRNVPDRTFAYYEFNPILKQALIQSGESDFTYQLSDYIQRYDARGNRTNVAPISDLGSQLKSVYILTGPFTASASEFVINGLRSYLGDKVRLVGNTTYGKNVGSIEIYEENDARNKWGMLPIVMKISNKDHFSDFGAGFTPGSSLIGGTFVNEFGAQLKPLGDENEPLLAEAIAQITGITHSSLRSKTELPRILGTSFDKKKGAFQMIADGKQYKNSIWF
jgi:hypothetical protein